MTEIEELSYPHCCNELVVLELPCIECWNHILGFAFPPDIKSLINSNFKHHYNELKSFAMEQLSSLAKTYLCERLVTSENSFMLSKLSGPPKKIKL